MARKKHSGQFTKKTAKVMGSKGGTATKLSGKVDYAEIGRRGAESRWKKISTGGTKGA